MGLPIHLVAAVNCNDIIHRTVQRGDFSLSETVKPTLASAMDIQVGPVGRHAVRRWVGGMDRAEIRVTPAPGSSFLCRCPTTWRGFSGCYLALTARWQEASWSSLKGPNVWVCLRNCKARSVTTHTPPRKERVQPQNTTKTWGLKICLRDGDTCFLSICSEPGTCQSLYMDVFIECGEAVESAGLESDRAQLLKLSALIFLSVH